MMRCVWKSNLIIEELGSSIVYTDGCTEENHLAVEIEISG